MNINALTSSTSSHRTDASLSQPTGHPKLPPVILGACHQAIKSAFAKSAEAVNHWQFLVKVCKNEGLALSYVLGGGVWYGRDENAWDAVIRSAHAPSIAFVTEHIKTSADRDFFTAFRLPRHAVQMSDQSGRPLVSRGLAAPRSVLFQSTGGSASYVLKNPDGSFFGTTNTSKGRAVLHQYTRTWYGDVKGRGVPTGVEYDMAHDDGSKTLIKVNRHDLCTYDIIGHSPARTKVKETKTRRVSQKTVVAPEADLIEF